MPREDRRIIFDHAETYKAIYAMCVQKEVRKPPPGVIASIAVKADDDQMVTIKISNPQDNTSATVEYSRDFLAAALMLFCRTLGVPLPKKARKSVDLAADEVVLRIMI